MHISCAYCKEPLTQSGEAITVCSGERMYFFVVFGVETFTGSRSSPIVFVPERSATTGCQRQTECSVLVATKEGNI
jgi:hypothetical protein